MIEVFYGDQWVEWEPEDILYQNEGTEFFPAQHDRDGNVKGLTLEEAVKSFGVKEFTLCRQNFTCRARVM